MDYREQIYKNYSKHLKGVMATKNLDKERALIYKYFKKNYLPYFPRNKKCKVLDVGCGLGSYMLAAEAFGYKNVEGVDVSAEVVQFCCEEGLNAICSRAEDFLRSKGNVYDVIMFNDMIEHLTKHEVMNLLYLMKKALKKNGKIIIKVVNSANPITGSTSRYIDFTHELGFSEISLRQVLYAVEFEKVSIKGADIYVGYLPLGYIVKVFAKVVNAIFFCLNCLYGRTTIKIYDKNLIAIAEKEKE